MSGDRIEITGIRGRGHHGVFDHERRLGQEFIVDVVLEVDLTAAGASDDLGDTVDYGVVAEQVHAHITGEPVDLLETLAERIAQSCLAHPGVNAVHLAIHKPQAPISVPFDDVVVRVRRPRTAPMRRAVLALGANLGDPAAALAAATRDLAALPGTRLVATSGVYRTAPVGGPAQEDFLNAVVVLETTMSPAELLAAGHRIEAEWGRTRQVRWGPRTLDIDLITVDDGRGSPVVVDGDELTLPHPRAGERAFVCVPWLEAAPGADLPGVGPVRRIIEGLDISGVERLPRALLAGG